MPASNMTQQQAHVSQPLPGRPRGRAVDFPELDAAFLEDAFEAAKPQAGVPRQIYTLAVIAVSVGLWGIIIAVVVSLI